MALEPATEETLAAIRNACGVDEKMLDEAGRMIKKWLEEQPHLPNCLDEKRLQLLYLQCKKRMGKVYASLDAYYSTKNTIPKLMSGRDPCAPSFKQSTEVVYWIPLPQLTDDLCRVSISGLIDTDLSKYNIYDVLKMDFMVHEVRLLEEFSPFEACIIDFAGSGPRHLAQFTLPVLRKAATILLDCYPSRIIAVHLINCPTYISVIVSLLKLVLKPKILNKIHVHVGGLGSLHDHVPPRILPVEYGGHSCSIPDMWNDWKLKVMKYRDMFIQQEQMKTDEAKRPRK